MCRRPNASGTSFTVTLQKRKFTHSPYHWDAKRACQFMKQRDDHRKTLMGQTANDSTIQRQKKAVSALQHNKVTEVDLYGERSPYFTSAASGMSGPVTLDFTLLQPSQEARNTDPVDPIIIQDADEDVERQPTDIASEHNFRVQTCFVSHDIMKLATPQFLGKHGFFFASAVCLNQIKCRLGDIKAEKNIIKPLYLATSVGCRHAFFGEVPVDGAMATRNILRNESLMGMTRSASLKKLLTQNQDCKKVYGKIVQECDVTYLTSSDIQMMALSSSCCIQIENSKGHVLLHKCPRTNQACAKTMIGRIAAVPVSGAVLSSWDELESMCVPILVETKASVPEPQVLFASVMEQDHRMPS